MRRPVGYCWCSQQRPRRPRKRVPRPFGFRCPAVFEEVFYMGEIRRYGTSRRWADVVVHRGVARWVEVADDTSCDVRGQMTQVFAQVDATLTAIGSDRTRLLEVLVFLADARDALTLNELWDAWVPAGHPPVRAMVQAGLSPGLRVELVVTAAVTEG